MTTTITPAPEITRPVETVTAADLAEVKRKAQVAMTLASITTWERAQSPLAANRPI